MNGVTLTLRPGYSYFGCTGVFMANCTMIHNPYSILYQFDLWFDREVEITTYFERTLLLQRNAT